MIRLALVLLLLAACGPARPPPTPCKVNDVACSDGEFFQCVCAVRVCQPGNAPGEWKRLGDRCP
jgi:hypothetical protein